MTLTISRTKLENLIKNLGGKIFNVCWIKKTGEVRCANVRQAVKSKKKGTGRGIANASNSYLTVYLMWNMQGNTFNGESGYRVINLDTIKYISVHGHHCKVTPEPIIEFHDTTATAA